MLITDIEDYFTKGCGRCERFATPACSTRLWIGGLNELRAICRDVGLVETVKWGQPCYMHAGRNIVVFGAFRGDYRLSFFHPALMQDPEDILETAGPNSEHPGTIRFTDVADVARLAPVIRSYLKQAMGYAEAGTLPKKAEREIDLPDEMIDAMDADPELAEAFHDLTPGRQYSYVIALNSAKKSETRLARIEKFRARILSGKGALER